ncbi:aldolase [Streptomyces rapamycinicus]|uniref:Aldolase n=2 Tax=Streptomyces rapamycinicus TaxID=1226757 RepID=A0A0A0NN30_STRRN|nr:aldolase [Streptomyces rapamycinicus]AGP60967.1 aldolase [Streptomyces rapamycinicus NRRL 5491]MBB4787858.1 ribulose-5-phosphate 4-epimerase/fuculose-1-phosphate aldolase [Streptomyces rapamycinicus]RLV72197.1 aldolase [Streptomyces rapamycinicus NRRL 5491]UTP36492.1 aldolase [Streptomyces rapamycinicus NRRL 5491]
MTELLDTAVDEARDEIVRVGTSLFNRGYVHASAGNISARIGDGHLITPTDAALGFLERDRLALVDARGEQRAGDRASKTLTLHRRIYAADPTARFIIHTHSTHLVALTLAGVWSQDDVLPPITPYFVMKVGHVPLIPYHRPGDPRVADLVTARIADHLAGHTPIRAVLLDRLGPVVWGPNAAAALAVLEELEETARLWLLTDRRPGPLTTDAIDELRTTFDATW